MKKLQSILILLLCVALLCACNGDKEPDGTTTAPTASTSAELTYSVSITDPAGNPVTSGVIVSFINGSEVAAMEPVNAQGLAQKVLPRGNYLVQLGFTDPEAKYHYDTTDMTLTADNSSKQIVLAAAAVEEEKTYSLYDPDTGEETTYREKLYYAGTGFTYIPLTSGERTHVYFTPEQSGVYQFSVVGSEAAIGYYGSPYFIQSENIAELDENGAFTLNVSSGMIGTSGTGTSTFVLGIDGGDLTDCIIHIERIADPEMTIEDYPWEIYAATVDLGAFTMSSSVQLKDFDLTADSYTLVLNEFDGFYHLNTADGPLVYAKLGVGSEYLDSIQTVLESSGIARYFYDEDGNFVKKVSYSECLLEYIACMDETTGLYPLTEDLAYIFQQRGDYVGWWDPNSSSYLFVDENGNPVPGINPEVAWLFLCCYGEVTSEPGPTDPDVTDPTTPPTEPSTKPTEPSTEPTTPPTEPSTEPTEPPTEPPHVHVYEQSAVPPSCLEQGYTRHTCSCGDSYDSDVTKATGHSWGEWKVTKEATETQTGTQERKCANCDTAETAEIPIVVPEHTHYYTSSVSKEATCKAEGVLTYTCSCGASYTESISKKDHSYQDKVTKPTCTDKGYTTHTCTVCSDSYTDSYTDKIAHSYATKVTEPTCTANGSTQYTCSACGDSYTESIPKTGHSYSSTVTAPTCTEKGFTTYTCSVCGDSYTGDEKDATGHSWGGWEMTTEYTIDTPGIETRACESCSISETRTVMYYFHVESTMSFNATVKAGDLTYYSLYRMFDMVLTIESEDAYLVFGDQVIEPKNGVLTFKLEYSSNDVSSPCEIAVGNSGNEDAVFTVKLSILPGTQNNPEILELGSFTTKTREGDYQGYYYTYTAESAGILTVDLNSIDIEYQCQISLYNLNTYTYNKLDTGTSVSMEVNAGDVVQINIAVVDEDNYEYPAATVVATATFE